MNPRDLVKGNIIKTEYGVLPIYHTSFGDIQVKGKGGRRLWVNDVEPVELTEEWLIKFGFKNINGFYEIDLPHDLTFIQGSKNDYFDVFEINHDTLRAKYVHQLQNLFYSLIGEELKLKDK